MELGAWAAVKPDAAEAIQRQPGFLLRRAHQIAVSIFLAQTAEFGLTESQYTLMAVLNARPGVDQAMLARLTGLDRATTGLVLEKLDRLGLVTRPAASDRRRKALGLTPAGRLQLAALHEPLQRARTQLLTPFTEAESAQLVALLTRFAIAHNAAARAAMAMV